MGDEFLEIHERVTAGRLLSLTASHVSEHMGSFGNWLLIGVGATYSLVLANLASVQQFVSLWSIRAGLLLLLAALILGVLQRWLAAIVSASSAAAEKSDKIGHDLAEQDIEIDFRALFREMELQQGHKRRLCRRRPHECRHFPNSKLSSICTNGICNCGNSDHSSWS